MKLEKGNFIWIIENGSRFECPIAIRRFQIIPRAAKKLRPQQLADVIEKFRRTGSVSSEKDRKLDKRELVPQRMMLKLGITSWRLQKLL